MAKKRKKKQTRKIVPIPTTLFIFLALGIAIGLSMAYEYYAQQPIEKKGELFKQVDLFVEEIKTEIDKGAATLSEKAVQVFEEVQGEIKTIEPHTEIPKSPATLNEQIINHTGFTISYNEKKLIPNWVAYELTNKETKGKAKRTNQFKEDPKVKGRSANDKDYTGSGYDRGHMIPAGDLKWDEKAMEESFYLSNICPQAPNLNRGVWRILEEDLRDKTEKDSTLLIACGPILVDKNKKTIGKSKVCVPTGFFKVVLAPFTQPVKGIAFLFPNDDCNKELSDYITTIDKVEDVTGIDFFYKLPDEIENKVEAESNNADWGY